MLPERRILRKDPIGDGAAPGRVMPKAVRRVSGVVANASVSIKVLGSLAVTLVLAVQNMRVRYARGAKFGGMRAAGAEDAARRRGQRAGNIAFQKRSGPGGARIRPWDR